METTVRLRASLLAAALATPLALPAQKLALRDGSDRQVAVIDLCTLEPAAAAGDTVAEADDRARRRATKRDGLVRLLNAIHPELTASGIYLQPLGEHHIVVLGSPQQVATAEGLVVRAMAASDSEIQIDAKIVDVPAAIFESHCKKLVSAAEDATPGGPRRAVVSQAAAHDVLRAVARLPEVHITQYPQPTVRALEPFPLRVGKQLEQTVWLVSDSAANTPAAIPWTIPVFLGHDLAITCLADAKGQVQLALDYKQQEMTPEGHAVYGQSDGDLAHTSLPTTCRGSMAVQMDNGATAALALRKADGRWLLVLTTPQQINRQAPLLPLFARPR